MPLPPPGKTEWPPKTLEAAYERYHVNATWYGGDPDQLSSLYNGRTAGWDRGDTRYRASQFQGGMVGKVARWFWGTPPASGELRSKLHLPIAEDIARMSADMLFAEPPKIVVEDDATQKRLDHLSEDGDLQARLLEGAEVGAALGDVYLVVTWDKSLRDGPWLRPVHGDAVVPEFRSGVLTAATIWTIVQEQDGRVWRHLERHEPGLILHGLYRGDSKTLGALVDVEDVQSLARLAQAEGVHRQMDGTLEIPTGVDRLLVEHIPNMLPNRLDRGSSLGRSDYSPGTLGLMDELDEVWSGLAREYRLAKARGVITEDAVKSAGPGQGAYFDDRELFLPLRINPNQQGVKPLELIQPLIRVEEHLSGARALTEQIIRGCGYSLQSFGEGTEVAATATEIQQRERLSYLTRGKKTLYWGRLGRAEETLLMVDREVFGSKVIPQRPKVEFGDSIAESDATTAQTLNLLNQAQSASIETRVRILHPEWDDTRIGQEVAAIRSENALSPVPDPAAAFHQGPGQDQVPGMNVPADGRDPMAVTTPGRQQ